jgi:hypothetical protein
MLIVLLNWLHIAAATFAFGYITLRYLCRFFRWDEREIHPALISVAGLGLITTLANYASLFMRVNYEFHLAMVAASLAFLLLWRVPLAEYVSSWLRRARGAEPILHAAAALLIFIALAQSLGIPGREDEGEYYLPTVRWIEWMRVVPGAALFHDRLGYNSAYHMSNAVFGVSYLFPGGLYDLSGFLFALLNIYCLRGAQRLLRRDYRDFSVSLMLTGIIIIDCGIGLSGRGRISAMDADYPHFIIGAIVLSLFLRKLEERRLARWDWESALGLILAAYLVSVKFLAVFLLLLPAGVLLAALLRGERRLFIAAALAGLFMVSPWLIRNYYISGYLVYPVYKVDLFNPDWKAPREAAVGNYNYVSEFAKVAITRYTYAYEGARDLPLSEWFPVWLKRMFATPHGAISVVLLLVFILIFLLLAIFRARYFLRERPDVALFLGAIALYLLFWFFRYPALRFGLGWMLCFFVTIMLALREMRYAWLPDRLRLPLLAGLFALLVAGAAKAGWQMPDWPRSLWRPQATIVPKQLEVRRMDGFTVYVAPAAACWGAPPPCAPNYYPLDNIEMRGERIQDGFRLRETE